MYIIDWLIGAALAAGGAYLANKKNEESRQKNEKANELVNKANNCLKLIKEDTEKLESELKQIVDGIYEIKVFSTKNLISGFIQFLDLFDNFDVIQKNESINTGKECEFITISELKEKVNNLIEIDNQIRDNKLVDTTKASLACAGVAISSAAIIGGMGLTSVSGASLLGIGFSGLAAGYGIFTIYNSYKANQNLQNAINFYNKTYEFAQSYNQTRSLAFDKISKFADIYKNFYEMNNKIGYIFNGLIEEFNEEISKNCPDIDFEINKIDIRILSPHFQDRLISLYSMICLLQGCFDIKLLRNDGKTLKSTAVQEIKKSYRKIEQLAFE